MAGQDFKSKSYPLRLSKTLHEVAKTSAEADGVSLNHFIEIAVAEKLARLQMEAVEKVPVAAKT